MIKFPAPKVAAPQFKYATRSKASRRAAEQRKKTFLAKAQRGVLAGVNAAFAGEPGPDGKAGDLDLDVKTTSSSLEGRQAEIEAQRAYEERFENSLEAPDGGLLSNLPHDA